MGGLQSLQLTDLKYTCFHFVAKLKGLLDCYADLKVRILSDKITVTGSPSLSQLQNYHLKLQ